MRLKVVGCGVFEPELTALVPQSPHQIELDLVDAGLHAEPDRLRREAQESIDGSQGCDAVVLIYGLCGRGTDGLVARSAPVVLPRVHDCFSLFLGSRAEYRRQFKRHPGTFYVTAGWYEHKIAPRGRAPSESLGRSPRHDDDPRFREWADKYGEQNAQAIIEFYDSWQRNYTRAAFIDTGLEQREAYEAFARDMAREFGWEYARLQGHTQLLEALLGGEWDRPDILVLSPGERSKATGDDRVLTSIQSALAAPALVRPVPATTSPESVLVQRRPVPGALGLGIDAGGTFTDCALIDFGSGKVLAKAKAPTTHRQLLLGVEAALDKLQLQQPEQISLVALSTTLATNAIAEDKGGCPGPSS